jgi:hypothetical protein
MKNHFPSKTLLALAVALAAAGLENPAHAQPVSATAGASALPAGIQPGTPAAEVVKLAQAGVDAGVIMNYINSCPGAFNVTADEIISLTDAGVSSDMVNAMFAHDKNLSTTMPQPAAPAPAPTDNVDSSPPPTEVDVTYFNDTLSPYGQWVQVDGYGRCWRPTVVVYDSGWSPYCDRGRWVYTDCGWYWDSDYSWGVTFHYGRWFHHDRFGWCWYPDTVWAPSWVTWRSSDDYCGWAPLPPFAVYRPGIGFFYRGASVAVGFDFGLSTSCFTFVSVGNFCQPHPRNYCVPRQQVTQIYNRTTVINNYNYSGNNRIIVNGGISVDRVRNVTHRPLQPVAVGSLPNAGRQGWHGDSPARNTSGQQLRHGPVLRDDHNSDATTTHRQNSGSPGQPPNWNENAASPGHSQQNMNPAANHNPATGSSFVRQQPVPSAPPQNNRQSGGNDRIQPQNENHQQQWQFTPANNAPVHSEAPQRSIPQIEQRQVVAPAAPEHPQMREQAVEPRVEQHQNPVVSAPHNAASPGQSQPRNSDNDKDRQNH